MSDQIYVGKCREQVLKVKDKHSKENKKEKFAKAD
jgi:hypothetical protein